MIKAADVAREEKSRKEMERKKKKAELEVCRIRKLPNDGKGYRTVGSGSVINNIPIDWPGYKDHCCLVTTDKVLPDYAFDLKDFVVDFRKLNTTFREFKLATYADIVLRFTSGLVVIPLTDPPRSTVSGKKPSIFTFRPFTREDNGPSGELFCPVVDDTDANHFAVKGFTLKYIKDQGPNKYVLYDGHSSRPFNTLTGFIGTSNRKPHGTVVLSDDELTAVGILYCSDDRPSRISPIWLSKENLSSAAMDASSVRQLVPRGLVPENVKARWSITSPVSPKVKCSETTPEEVLGRDGHFSTRTTLKVTLLGGEWNSSAGGLSTLNRELAIHLSEQSKLEVTLLVPKGACKYEEKREAQSFGITAVDAKELPGFDPLDWLSFPPEHLSMNIVVGHGVKLGRQGQVIRDSAQFPNCKWVQVVHTAPEDLGRYKTYADPISKGERKHEVEVELCKRADLVVPVGPRLKEAYSSYLRRSKPDQDVFSVTPGLFDREFGDLRQAHNENAEFKVLLCGRGDDEDFELKGYNIAVKAFTDQRLKGKPYHLLFVGAPDGKLEEITRRLPRCGIDVDQLTVRSYIQSRDKLKDLFCEVDLAIMPSKTEGFGLVALEALSAGLPILVGSKSGFAKALENVHIGHSCVVYSDDPTKWAEAIEAVRVGHRTRLEEIKTLKVSYKKQYSWKEQCETLAEKMWKMVNGSSITDFAFLQEAEPHSSQQPPPIEENSIFLKKEENAVTTSKGIHNLTSSDQEGASTSQSNLESTPGTGSTITDFAFLQEAEPHSSQQPQPIEESSISLEKEENAVTTSKKIHNLASCDQGSSNVNDKSPEVGSSAEKQLVALTSHAASRPPSNQQTLLDEETKDCGKNEGSQAITVQIKITTQDLDDYQQDIFDDSVQQMATQNLSTDEGLSALTEYLTESHSVLQKGVTNCGLEMIVECSTPEIFQSLLNDYYSGHLNEVAERCLVTDTIKSILNLETLRLKTVIQEVADQNPIIESQEAVYKLHSNPQPRQVEARSISESISNEELFCTEDTIPQVTEQQPAAETNEVYNPHSSPQLQPINGRSILLTNEEDERRVIPFVDKEFPVEQPITAYTPDAVSRPPSNHQTFLDEEEKAHGIIEDGTSTSQSNLESTPDTGAQAIAVQLKISPQDLNDQQKAIFDAVIQEMEEHHNLSTDEGPNALIKNLSNSYKVLQKRFTNSGLEITVECPTQESFESLCDDCGSGHLNEVAERSLVTEKIKTVLNLETVRLETVFNEESYLEMLRVAGITSNPSDPSEPDQGASARWTDTSSKIQKASRGALHKASTSGQYETVKMLLQSGENVDQRDQFSLTPLHLACWYGRESVIKLLLDHGANINAVDRFRRTPLQKAERHNYQSIVQLLMKNNASPTYQPLSLKSLAQKAFLYVEGRSGYNLLQAYVLEGNYSIIHKVCAYLDNFVGEMNLKTTGKDAKLFPGKTAVDIISNLDKSERCYANIDERYQESVKKVNTFTELHWCADRDDAEETVELVLNNSVDINIPALCNRTPLLWASVASSSVFIKTLINLGADVNAQRTDDKVTPLYVAAVFNNYSATHLLLEHGADVNIQDNYGNAPLHVSTRNGFYEVSKLLIEARSNINLRNKKGRTPLYNAVEKKHEQLIELLLESNADVSMGYKEDPEERIYLVRGKDKGKPAWHYVLVEKHLFGLFLKGTSGGSLDVADYGTILESGWGKDPPKNTIDKILKKHEYDAMFKEIQGETLLHVASRNNNIEIVDLLVKYGAWNVNARDAEGFTPLHVAAIHGNMQVVKKLVDLKADVNQAIGIADMAHMNEEFETEEYLKSKMDSQTTRRNEVERVDAMGNLFTGARVISREVVRVGREAGRIGRQFAQVAAEVVVDRISRVF